ncbi:MAG: C1 family peptidase [Eubacteriales bacterium]|nr:C1 family peptidase [Eubacteriales bacterium]
MEKISAKLTLKQLKRYRKLFNAEASNRAYQASIVNVGIDDVALNPEAVKRHSFVFEHECKQGGPTSQNQSGRCWYYAALNSLRQIVMEKLNVESIELSQTYLYFFDKMEKANIYLENMIAMIDKPLTDRRVQTLIDSGSEDGGLWQFFTVLCLKYGIVPQECMPETFHSKKSYMFTKQLDVRLRQCLMEMRHTHAKGADIDALRQLKDQCLASCYLIASKALGELPEKFRYAYRDKDKKYVQLEEMTPLEFFEKYIGKEALEERVVIVSDPREIHPYYQPLSFPDVRNVYNGPTGGGLNVPIEDLSDAVLKSVKDGTPVWFACDVGKLIDRKRGLLDLELYNYDLVLDPLRDFSKADQFDSGYSSPTHAMSICGVECDSMGEPVNWKVENSWSEEMGKKGTFSMSHEWFLAYTYEAIVARKYLSEAALDGLKKKAIELDPWDPFAIALSSLK